MQLEDILESNYLYCQQNISVPFLICNVVLPYPGTDNILEIFYEFVLDNLKMYFHQTSHTVWTICFPSKLVAPNKTDSWWDPVIFTTGLSSFPIHTFLTSRVIEEEWFIGRYYCKPFFLLESIQYLSCSFLKRSFSSFDAVFTCVFLSTFCLNPHLCISLYIWV